MLVTRKWLVATESTIAQSLMLFLSMVTVERSILASWVTFAWAQGVVEMGVGQSDYV